METPEPPVVMGEPTDENPSGIESVSEEHAKHIGGLRGYGGPGAAGATVGGPEAFVATEGGTIPLPHDGMIEAPPDEELPPAGDDD